MIFLLILALVFGFLFFAALSFAASWFPPYQVLAESVFWLATVFYFLTVLRKGGNS